MPNSVTTADGLERPPNGTISTLKIFSTPPPTRHPMVSIATVIPTALARTTFLLFIKKIDAHTAMAVCKPGGLSNPGGLETPWANTQRNKAPNTTPDCVKISLDPTSNTGMPGSALDASFTPCGMFLLIS